MSGILDPRILTFSDIFSCKQANNKSDYAALVEPTSSLSDTPSPQQPVSSDHTNHGHRERENINTGVTNSVRDDGIVSEFDPNTPPAQVHTKQTMEYQKPYQNSVGELNQ